MTADEEKKGIKVQLGVQENETGNPLSLIDTISDGFSMTVTIRNAVLYVFSSPRSAHPRRLYPLRDAEQTRGVIFFTLDGGFESI